MQQSVALPQDRAANVFRQRGVGNAGNDVIGVRQVELPQHRAHVAGRAADHAQARIGNFALQKSHEFRIQLDGHQHRIWPHALQDFLGDVADAGAVFHDDPSSLPVDPRKHPLD